MTLVNALPGAVAQGLIWAIMAIGVYITYRVLDIADLTVDGTLCTGGAVCIMCMLAGCNVWVAIFAATGAGLLAGFVTGIFHTFMGIQPILAGILTQLALWSINLKIMGKSNQAINVDKYDLLVSLRYIKDVPFWRNTILVVAVVIAVVIGLLYWFFGTELGCGIRATGCNANMARAQGINTNLWRCPVRCWPSTRALPTSTWAAGPSSSAWPPSSSARRCWARCSATSPSKCSAWRWAASCTTWSISW